MFSLLFANPFSRMPLQSCLSAPTLLLLQPLQRTYATKRFKQLGSDRPPAPETEWTSYGGRPFEAVVTRVSTDKTVAVERCMYVRHPTYKVEFKKRTRLLAHDANNICHVGDRVLVAKSRPFSQQKHHVVKDILEKDPGVLFLAKNPELFVSAVTLRGTRREEMKLRSLTKEEKKERDAAAAAAVASTAASSSSSSLSSAPNEQR